MGSEFGSEVRVSGDVLYANSSLPLHAGEGMNWLIGFGEDEAADAGVIGE